MTVLQYVYDLLDAEIDRHRDDEYVEQWWRELAYNGHDQTKLNELRFHAHAICNRTISLLEEEIESLAVTAAYPNPLTNLTDCVRGEIYVLFDCRDNWLRIEEFLHERLADVFNLDS